MAIHERSLDLGELGAPAPVPRGPIHDLRCLGCGYGVAKGMSPGACPICRGLVWEPAPWRPFSQLAREMQVPR
jgi:hypothetical protein